MKTPKKEPHQAMVYAAYRYGNVDPALQVIDELVSKSGYSYSEIRELGGAHPSTLRGWNKGKRRSGRFDTIAASARAIGCDIEFVDKKGNRVPILPKQEKVYSNKVTTVSKKLRQARAARAKKTGKE